MPDLLVNIFAYGQLLFYSEFICFPLIASMVANPIGPVYSNAFVGGATLSGAAPGNNYVSLASGHPGQGPPGALPGLKDNWCCCPEAYGHLVIVLGDPHHDGQIEFVYPLLRTSAINN